MGFNSVYRVLQEVFPQVDTRMLRAVAIEHSKDADTAVEVVLVEVIPHLSKGSVGDVSHAASPKDAHQVASISLDETVGTRNGSSSYDASAVGDQVCVYKGNEELVSLEKHEKGNEKVSTDLTPHVTLNPIVHESSRDDDCNRAFVNTECDEMISLHESSNVKLGSDHGSNVSLTTAKHDNSYTDGSMNVNLLDGWERFDGPSSSYDANAGGDQVCVYKGNEELVSLEKHEKGNEKVSTDVTPHVTLSPIGHESSGDDDCDRACVNTECDEMISLHECCNVKLGSEHGLKGLNVSLTTSNHDNICTDGSMNVNLLDGWERFDGPSASDCIHVESCQEQLCLDDKKLDVENSVVQLASTSVQECTSATPEGCAKQVDTHKLSNECEPEANGSSSDVASKKEMVASELVDVEPTLNTVVTRSGQICRIDLLEDIIEDARNNKKTLFSAMESVLSLMKEVELQEKAAEQAKEEAARGGLDILTRVEDLKEMLQHAKEANDMHAGEVYGERAILGTEVRELQSRLLSLSDERDKSLAILDEMCLNLEERLDVAEKERKAAEQEKMEKVESARNALAEQELIMEKVVQESKILEQEAEENSKLREFLMDRGRVVDMLQGEISVICHDVKFLKEKFDERVPLSKSLSSSQTSCILASSSSLLKSMAPDQVTEQAESSVSPKKKKNSPSPSVDDQLSSGEEKAGTDSKALVDDGWEFFDADV